MKWIQSKYGHAIVGIWYIIATVILIKIWPESVKNVEVNILNYMFNTDFIIHVTTWFLISLYAIVCAMVWGINVYRGVSLRHIDFSSKSIELCAVKAIVLLITWVVVQLCG